MEAEQIAMQISQIEADLVACGSIELISTSNAVIHPGQELLPHAMSVLVPALANRELMTNLSRMQSLSQAGFNPVPHIAARRLVCKSQLQEFLSRAVKECKVRRILLIAGDRDHPVGPFKDTLDLLDSGIIESSGIKEISFAGHPEGHPLISRQKLQQAMTQKLAWADNTGISASVMTQFSFSPARIIQFCSTLAHEAPGVPVYVGMAGPTNAVSLMRFAKVCGVSASLRTLKSQGLKVAKLALHTDPAKQLHMLAHHCHTNAGNNIIGVHLYSFGGFTRSAQWMHDVIASVAVEPHRIAH